MTPVRYSNRAGFPCLESTTNSLTSVDLTYNFATYPIMDYFYGGMFIKITNTPTAPETAVPVYFNDIVVLDAQGEPLTTETFPGNGIYLAFYDKDSKKLQLLNV
jgi:hypothetical protein